MYSFLRKQIIIIIVLDLSSNYFDNFIQSVVSVLNSEHGGNTNSHCWLTQNKQIMTTEEESVHL